MSDWIRDLGLQAPRETAIKRTARSGISTPAAAFECLRAAALEGFTGWVCLTDAVIGVESAADLDSHDKNRWPLSGELSRGDHTVVLAHVGGAAGCQVVDLVEGEGEPCLAVEHAPFAVAPPSGSVAYSPGLRAEYRTYWRRALPEGAQSDAGFQVGPIASRFVGFSSGDK